MVDDTVHILEGNTFVISDRSGDIDATPDRAHGLFHDDTRFLSRWLLTLGTQVLKPLSTDDLDYFAAQFFVVPGSSRAYVDSPLSVIRKRAVGDGFHEDVRVLNNGQQPLDLELRLAVAADFADLFEVRERLAKKGEYYRRCDAGERLVLGYRRERFVRETWVTNTGGGVICDEGLRFRVHVPAHGEWSTCLEVVIARSALRRTPRRVKYEHGNQRPKPNIGGSLEAWLAGAPQLISSWQPFQEIYRRSLVDLAALRFYPSLAPGSLPAAGLPWFMALFGRDSIITSLQALPFVPELARTTLIVLAQRQGTSLNDFRDEEPGKILHEARLGEMTAFEERPQSPYYGSADATPLFLILLDEYELWTGDGATVQKLEREARAALAWIDDYGDLDGDGYIEYQTRNPRTGLGNQGWKDSGNAILNRDGSLPPLPRACCELQGYAYDAKRRCARLARDFWGDPALADALERQAAQLRERFNRDFWIAERGFYALALDGDKRQVDSLTSNIGHLLWSGIAAPDKAAACVRHLLGPELFSGWGVRTMGTREGGYNPIGYHVGTVWPHDNSLIAWGLRRYGYRDAAARVAWGILEAAPHFAHRLPEVFAGYAREETQFPVEYPTACSPQAWATAAPLLFLRTLLGLQPIRDRLFVDPAIPMQIERLELLGIHGRWGEVDAFGRGRIALGATRSAAKAKAE